VNWKGLPLISEFVLGSEFGELHERTMLRFCHSTLREVRFVIFLHAGLFLAAGGGFWTVITDKNAAIGSPPGL